MTHLSHKLIIIRKLTIEINIQSPVFLLVLKMNRALRIKPMLPGAGTIICLHPLDIFFKFLLYVHHSTS